MFVNLFSKIFFVYKKICGGFRVRCVYALAGNLPIFFVFADFRPVPAFFKQKTPYLLQYDADFSLQTNATEFTAVQTVVAVVPQHKHAPFRYGYGINAIVVGHFVERFV